MLDDGYRLVTIDRQRHIVVERTLGFIDRMVKAITEASPGQLHSAARHGVNELVNHRWTAVVRDF